MLRKVFIIALSVFFPPILQLQFGILIIIFAVEMHRIIDPYQSALLYRLEFIGLQITLFTLIIAILFTSKTRRMWNEKRFPWRFCCRMRWWFVCLCLQRGTRRNAPSTWRNCGGWHRRGILATMREWRSTRRRMMKSPFRRSVCEANEWVPSPAGPLEIIGLLALRSERDCIITKEPDILLDGICVTAKIILWLYCGSYLIVIEIRIF